MRNKAIELLIARAFQLPKPHRARALANIFDAVRDLDRHPGYENQIITDCQRAVDAHEKTAREG